MSCFTPLVLRQKKKGREKRKPTPPQSRLFFSPQQTCVAFFSPASSLHLLPPPSLSSTPYSPAVSELRWLFIIPVSFPFPPHINHCLLQRGLQSEAFWIVNFAHFCWIWYLRTAWQDFFTFAIRINMHIESRCSSWNFLNLPFYAALPPIAPTTNQSLHRLFLWVCVPCKTVCVA